MKKIFTLLFLLIIVVSGFSQTNYYVNDPIGSDVAINNVFTTAPGSDANTGTAASPFATLNKAILAAITGDIIYVDAGTYTPLTAGGEVINKSLTIRGANYLVSPNDAADPLLASNNRNAETIITNNSLVIGANNINIAGMTFDPLTNFAIKQTNNALDFDNVNISKNIFRNKSDNRSIQIYGKFQATLVTFDCFITDNRFIKDEITGNTAIIIAGINNVQILNNTFTVSADIANRIQADINLSTFRSDNVVISQNIAYRQNNLVSGINALNARIDFNKAIECNRFSNASNNLNDPCIIDISDNIVTDPKGGASSIGYQRNNGLNLTSPNIARIERNTVTVNGTGLSTIPTALISASLNDNTQNSQVYIRDNKLSFSGSFSSLSNASAFISGINFFNNSRQAVVERNEIEFNASNYNANNKNGIYILHYNLQSGTNFDILNNKVSGFPTSLAIQQDDPFSATDVGPFGQLPGGVTVNINNNSFAGDIMSINNGTISQQVQATCNWYNTVDPEVLITKISPETGDYLPWLINGTDNEPLTTGFQPVPGSCTGRITKWYVNDNSLAGDVFTTAVGNDANEGFLRSIPFATMTAALANLLLQAGDTIYVDAGTYAEDVIVNKSVTILGVQNGVNPGTLLNRGVESVFVPVSAADPVNRVVIRLQANNIVIDGLTVDGDNPSLSGSVILNGVDINAGFGFAKLTEPVAHNNIIIRNNIIKNFYRYGVSIQSTTALPLSGNLIEKNHIDNISAQNVDGNTGRTGRGVALFNNGYTSVMNNVFTRNYIGILLQGNDAPSLGTYFITGNKMETYSRGMVINNLFQLANHYQVNENEVSTANLNTWNVLGSSTVNNNIGLSMFHIYNTAGLSFTNNKIDGTWKGFLFDDIINSIPVNNNSITGTLSSAIEYSNFIYESHIDASCNWYGSASAQNFINKISLTTVDVAPWLTDGTDNDAATGFQPVDGSCDGYPTLITLDSYTDVTCNGAANGSINITTTYGKAPFTYTWTKDADANFVSHDEDPTNLAPGTYHLAIVDGNGSTLYVTDPEADGPGIIDVTITEPDILTASASGTNVSCFNGANGSASVSVTGGTELYSYAWSNNETTASISNLAAGTFSVTVTDANGCTATSEYIVTQPPALTATTQIVNNLCYNGTIGSISVTAAGGTAGYEYSLNGTDYQGSNVFNNLTANNYTVYIKDNNGCVVAVAALVTQPPAIIITTSNVTNTCSGSATGSITISVVGGTGAYSYSWTGPNGFAKNSKNLTSLVAGTYYLTVTDANGCTATSQAEVGVLPAITLGGAITQVQCFGTTTGAVNITVGGGSGAFSFTWSGPNGYKATTEDISNIKAGTYSVTVKDAAGCSISQSFIVTEPVALTVTINKTNINTCNGTGSITAIVTGGTMAYQYKLNNGAFQPGNVFNNLPVGSSYAVTVRDANGCQATVSSIGITDTGDDLYEPNDNISPFLSSLQLNQPVQARIAPSKNDKDYFLFTTGAIPASYTLSLTNSPVSYTFAIYDNKGKAIATSSYTATTKTYNSLALNTTYYPGVTGTSWSMLCYTLEISNSVPPAIVNRSATKENREIVIDKFNTSVFPNPHHGSFGIKIESSQEGTAIVEILNSLGQMISSKRIAVNKGGASIANFTRMHHSILFYRVSIGNEMKAGKIIGPN